MFQKSQMSTLLVPLLISTSAIADERLFGGVKGSETLPQGALEFDVTNKVTTSAYELNHDISSNIGATLSALNVTGRQAMASIASSGVI